jgi:hypothetical protein
VTCDVPSARRVTPSNDRSAPRTAIGFPFVRSGGQYVAQVPEQALRRPLSFSNR